MDSVTHFKTRSSSLAKAVKLITAHTVDVEVSSKIRTLGLKQAYGGYQPETEEIAQLAQQSGCSKQQLVQLLLEMFTRLPALPVLDTGVNSSVQLAFDVTAAVLCCSYDCHCKAPAVALLHFLPNVLDCLEAVEEVRVHQVLELLFGSIQLFATSSFICECHDHCHQVARAKLLDVVTTFLCRYPELQETCLGMGKSVCSTIATFRCQGQTFGSFC